MSENITEFASVTCITFSRGHEIVTWGIICSP